MKNIETFTNRIIQGNCLEIMPQIPSGSIGLVVTDPPYLVNYQPRDGRRIAGDNDDSWLKPAFSETYRVLKKNSFLICFYGFNNADKFLTAWKSAGFEPRDHLVFQKKYPSSKGFVARYHECAYLLTKGNPERPNVILPSVMGWQYTGNRLHPTQKPVMSLRPLIKVYSKPWDIVLDPFAGSGSTLVASKQANRKYIGIELDRSYSKIAKERLQTG